MTESEVAQVVDGLPPSPSACVVCGCPLGHRRADALVCGAACRRERCRVLAILAGRMASPYRSLAQYTNRRRRRANRAARA